ncbi:MAG: hypothetical protein EXQ70_08665 [Solirubrobacterales bacterium]|nr:hypothetical protein [Solirubrobacterales bacterium]
MLAPAVGADSTSPTELTELVPEPGSGRVFERRFRPGIAEVTRSGRVRLDAIAGWLQDIAYLDSVDSGYAGRGAWIVRRTRIRVSSFPRFGEELSLRTYCSGIGRFSAMRSTTIRGEAASVDSIALWVFLDVEGRRPMRLPDDFVAAYSEAAGGRDANVRLRHPEPPPGAARSEWSFRATEIDMADHVNNAHYWLPVEEELSAGDEPDSIDAEVEFREPALAGTVALLRADGGLWVAAADGEELHASILRAR